MSYDVDKILLSRLRETLIRIELLNMQDKVLEFIKGECISGGINIDGDSSVRRTGTITLLTTSENYKMLEINNKISINKRVRINIGIRSIESGNEPYWFNCGIFVLTGCSINSTINSRTISITLQDKMCLHNGEIGGKVEYNTRLDVENIQPEYYSDVVIVKDTTAALVKSEILLESGCATILESLDNIYPLVRGVNYSLEKLIIELKTQTNKVLTTEDAKELKKEIKKLSNSVSKFDISSVQKKLLIKDIIKYLAISIAGEKPGKVIINDIPNKIKTPVKISDGKDVIRELDSNTMFFANFSTKFEYIKMNENYDFLLGTFINTKAEIDKTNKVDGEGSAYFNGIDASITSQKINYNHAFPIEGSIDFYISNLDLTLTDKKIFTIHNDTKEIMSLSYKPFNNPTPQSNTILIFKFLSNTGEMKEVSTNVAIKESGFTHIAICWGNSSTGMCNIFIDGERRLNFLALLTVTTEMLNAFNVTIFKDTVNNTFTKGNINNFRFVKKRLTAIDFDPLPLIRYRIENDGPVIGFKVIDYIYPSELSLVAGQPVTQGYEACKQALGGNFHYYYDINGNFVFEEIKNYMNNNIIPIGELRPDNYKMSYDAVAVQYDFSNSDIIPTFTNTPVWSNIKNDLYVWGAGENYLIGYHLAIDEKPFLPNYLINLTKRNQLLDWREYIIHNYNVGINYNFVGKCDETNFFLILEHIEKNQVENAAICLCEKDSYRYVDINKQSIAPVLAQELPRYYRELSTIWFNDRYYSNFLEKKENDIFQYHFDLISGDKDLNKFSIDTIGKRTDVINDPAIKSLYPTQIQEVLVYYDDEDLEYTSAPDKAIKVSEAKDLSKYLPYGEIYKDAFSSMKNMLNSRIGMNEQVSMTSLPIYYLDVNKRDYIADKTTSIRGYYLCKKINFNFTDAGLMNTNFIKAYSQISGVKMANS